MSTSPNTPHEEPWYQTIDLKDGTTIRGKVDTRKRIPFLEGTDFRGKSVIDVGCNSGQFCLYAKERGAERVVGIDIFDKRLEQARELAEREGLDISYLHKNLFELPELGVFDIVFCFAVVTEIADLFGALRTLKDATKETLYLELDLAKPLAYISISRNWRHPDSRLSRGKALAEVRFSDDLMVLSPTFEVLEAFFGETFRCEHLGKSIRYDMVRITRR